MHAGPKTPRFPPLARWWVPGFAGLAGIWLLLGGWLLYVGELEARQRLLIDGVLGLSLVLLGILGWRSWQAERLATRVAADEPYLQLLHSLVESSTDAIFAKDVQGRYLMVNRGASLIGIDDHAAFPEQAEEIRANDRRVMAQDHAEVFEETIQTAGGLLTYQSTKGPLRDSNGRVMGMFGISRDITAQRVVLERLRESEQRYRLMFEAFALPLVVFDAQSLRFLAVNDAAVAQYGYTRDEFLAMDLGDIHTPEDRARMDAEIERGRRSPASLPRSLGRWAHRLRDGRLILVEVATNGVQFGRQSARMALFQDVTAQVELERERRNALTQAQHSRDLLSSVLERVADGFVALDRAGTYTYVNVQAAEMLGCESPEVLLGRHIWTAFPASVGTPFHAAYLKAVQTQQAAVVNEYFEPRGRWFETRLYPSAEGITYFISDTTEREKAATVLRDRERDFRQLAEQMPALIYRAALDGSNRTLYVSQHVRVLGFTPEQWLADDLSWVHAVHPDDLERAVATLPSATSSFAEAQIEYRMRDSQGRWRHFRDSCRRIQPDGGGEPYLQGVSVDITEHREAEEALRQSETQLRQSEQRYRLAASSGMVWDWDLQQHNLDVGKDFFRRLGLEPVKGPHAVASLAAVMHPQDRTHWQEVRRGFLRGERDYNCRFRAADAQGKWRWFHTQGQGIRDEAGRVTYMAGTTVEITARVEAEEALRESEARLRQSEQRYRLAASNGLVWDWDLESGRLGISADQWRQLGYAALPEQDNLTRFSALLHPQDRPLWERMASEHLNQRKPYDLEYRVRDASGAWRWLHTRGQAVWNEEGRATYMAGTTVDITARKQAQAELQASEAYRRQLFEQLSDGVLLLDADHRIQDANPQALSMLGYEQDGLLGHSLNEVLAEQEADRMADLSQAHTPLREWTFVRRDGQPFPVEVSTRALDQRRYLAVLRDISVRRASENALMTYQLELSELTHQLLVQEKQTSRRIAQALHDRLGQTLAVIRLHLDSAVTLAGDGMPPDLKRQCGRIDGLLAQAVGEVRDVLRELRPPLLDEQGLMAALDNEVSAPATALDGVDVLLEVDDGARGQQWPPEIEYGAFMVAREAIANALLHAQPSLVRVLLAGHPTELRLDVIDDGAGIPEPMAHGRTGHLGIVGMRERAITMGAQFSVSAIPQGGTQVSLRWQAPPP